MAEMKISNTLVNDTSSGEIAYARQLKDNAINYAQYAKITAAIKERFHLDDKFQDKLNNFFLYHYDEFHRFLEDGGVDPTIIDSWKEVQDFLEGLPDGEVTWLKNKLTQLDNRITAMDIPDGGAYDVSADHVDGEGNYAVYTNLSDAINAIPPERQKGGMSVRFVQSSDNKYVQYRFLLSDSFTDAQFANTYNWLSVEDEVLKQVGISISQTAALVVSESPQTIRVNFATSNKGTFKIAFDGGTSSAFAIKIALYKDITNAQGFVYESGYFAFNQQIEYSGNEFNIAVFTIYANKVATAGDALVIIKTGLVSDIQNNRNAIDDSEAKNLSTMFYTKGYLLSGSATYDDNGLVVSSDIVWSDGVTGTLTRSVWDDNALEYKRDIVTHGTQNVQYDRIYNYIGEISKETITIN